MKDSTVEMNEKSIPHDKAICWAMNGHLYGPSCSHWWWCFSSNWWPFGWWMKLKFAVSAVQPQANYRKKPGVLCGREGQSKISTAVLLYWWIEPVWFPFFMMFFRKSLINKSSDNTILFITLRHTYPQYTYRWLTSCSTYTSIAILVNWSISYFIVDYSKFRFNLN